MEKDTKPLNAEEESLKATPRPLRANLLSSLTPKYVEDEELRDAPARLYRKILNKLEMNPRKWNSYLARYLDWCVPKDLPAKKAKAERITRTGNIKDTYFHKHYLTFNKLLEGLSILRMESCEIQLKVTDTDGKVYIVSESIRIVGKDRPMLTAETENE